MIYALRLCTVSGLALSASHPFGTSPKGRGKKPDRHVLGSPFGRAVTVGD